MYSRIDTSGLMATIDYTLVHVLATVDQESLVRERDPWIEYLFYSELMFEDQLGIQ